MYVVSDLRLLYFFFSKKRGHTRCSRDWSSDVCSSDLLAGLAAERRNFRIQEHNGRGNFAAPRRGRRGETTAAAGGEIGRASCRKRVEISVVAVSLKKKKENAVDRDDSIGSRN